jgi:hypothetical protein
MMSVKLHVATAIVSLVALVDAGSDPPYNNASTHQTQNSTGAVTLPASTVTTTVNHTTTINQGLESSSSQPR